MPASRLIGLGRVALGVVAALLVARIPSRVQALLRAEGLPVEVLTFAIDNTEMDNWIMYHREFGKKYSPDLVIVLTPRGRVTAGVLQDEPAAGRHLFTELPHG